ncbi:hypothetical protein G7Y89_g5706 [Cudoniella acicularis]|uniref:Peptidase S54 rhomboid domain-containing protein n=1 Tax=Cudoniella acicularis TaxID=354080 RepID=A0A8H4RNK4_9HELO|nr:hypothetical protein G7Y89_g5706 [Cudoniella acicularis]
MNSLTPSISRISCLNSRTILQTCYKADSLAARLAQRQFRSFSNCLSPWTGKGVSSLGGGIPSNIARAPIAKFVIQHSARRFASRQILVRFEELPSDYDPEIGLPFRDNPLSKDEVKMIFGNGIDAGTANRIVSMVHGRRVAGTLEDPEAAATMIKFERLAVKQALQWLRTNVPVDEVANAGRRAEQELREMEADILADSERIGLYKPNSEKTSHPYSKSGLDAIRKSKERKLDRKLDRQEREHKRKMSQADEIQQNTGTLRTTNSRGVELRRPGQHPKLKYYLERAEILPDKPPEMTNFQRLWPSALVVVGVILVSYGFTQVYTPPKNSVRMWPDMPPSAATIIGIILANAIILGAWRVPALFRFLNMNFITVPGYVYPFSLIGNTFSHQQVGHFAMNMFILWFAGTRLHEDVGRANFLAIYMCSGVLGSFASLTSFVIRNSFVSSSLGASGAVSGVIAAYLWLHGTDKLSSVDIARGIMFRVEIWRERDGRIFTNTSLLSDYDTPSEVAFLIVHEVAHVIARHTTEQCRYGGYRWDDYRFDDYENDYRNWTPPRYRIPRTMNHLAGVKYWRDRVTLRNVKSIKAVIAIQLFLYSPLSSLEGTTPDQNTKQRLKQSIASINENTDRELLDSNILQLPSFASASKSLLTMASHQVDNLLHGRDHTDTHASPNRWRHQESASFLRHAGLEPREADERDDSKDLAKFLNSARVEPPGSAGSGSGSGKYKPLLVAGNVYNGTESQTVGDQPADGVEREPVPGTNNALEVRCGPLLNYRRMENETWFGSVLVVTRGGGRGESTVIPELTIKIVGTRSPSAINNGTTPESGTNGVESEVHGLANGVDYGNGESSTPPAQIPVGESSANGLTNDGEKAAWEAKVEGTKLYSDPANTFWRFDLQVPMQQSEIQCEYNLSGLEFSTKKGDKQNFFIPAITESMRIMFHSCNGFSVGTDEEAWSGAALWNDVNRVHQKTPFHVMLGGGDQIYNDGIRVDGPLRKWTDIANPKKRRDFPFPESLRKDCDTYYVSNYIRWYGTEPFATANGQIPQVNLWDDHDIIDGFGSYIDDFMRCAVFRGIGGVANKYYLLFQHHLAPPVSTFTTDAPQTTSDDGVGVDPRQLEDTYVLEEKTIDSSYIIGSKPGPYVAERSRSIYARLGARIAFFGIDARTEVNYLETYDIIVNRLRDEFKAAKSSPTPIQHLIVLLGIPIAYPRLTWLENIFSSPLIAPIKFLNKRFGLGGSFFNRFDGSVDLLDDLDDHYTAGTHKKERLMLVHKLQELAAEFSVRISILGGDVHLAAVGRFYSNLKLNIPIVNDHRYMVNIISSAIVNKPPPQAVANLLARRNKIHHLDQNTDETLMKYFDKDPGTSQKTAQFNHVTMPSRNWAMITENSGTQAQLSNGHLANGNGENTADAPLPTPKDGHSWLHKGEMEAGTKHKAAHAETHGGDADGSLDVCIRVEKDQHDKEGKTEQYGMTVPTLTYDGSADVTMRKRDAIPGTINEKI